jgi:hypothetical protein
MPALINEPVTPTEALQAAPTVESNDSISSTNELLKTLDKLRGYSDNWGTYGEKAVKRAACDQAENFINNFGFWKPTVKLQVYPTAGGDIGIDWKLDSKDFAAVFSESEVTLLIDDDNDTCDDLVEHKFQAFADLWSALKSHGFSGV